MNLVTSSGESFASEGACTSYAAQGGTLTVDPYADARTLCESQGGTFGVGGPDMNNSDGSALWVCNGFANDGQYGYELAQSCLSDEGATLFSVHIERDALYGTCYS